MKMQVKTFHEFGMQMAFTRSSNVQILLDVNRRAAELAAEFASFLGPDRVVSVSGSTHERMTIVNVWCWTNDAAG